MLIDDGACATSPNFPNNYGPNEACTISNVPRMPLVVMAFDVQDHFDYDDSYDPSWTPWVRTGASRCDAYDYLLVGGTRYCGANGPDGAVPPDGVITWHSSTHGSTFGGWKAPQPVVRFHSFTPAVLHTLRIRALAVGVLGECATLVAAAIPSVAAIAATIATSPTIATATATGTARCTQHHLSRGRKY